MRCKTLPSGIKPARTSASLNFHFSRTETKHQQSNQVKSLSYATLQTLQQTTPVFSTLGDKASYFQA
jgi:hypothetical protein